MIFPTIFLTCELCGNKRCPHVDKAYRCTGSNELGQVGELLEPGEVAVAPRAPTYTLRACPFCGHQPEEGNLIDSVHPLNRERDLWTAGCVDNEGGCNASVLGGTREHAIALWNTRRGESREVVNKLKRQAQAKRLRDSRQRRQALKLKSGS